MISSNKTNLQNPNKRINANELFVLESGAQNDKTILFLHGSGSNSNMWLKQIAKLDDDAPNP